MGMDSKRLAAECYSACNRELRSDKPISASVCEWYVTWDTNPYMKHQAEYYNLRSKRYMWLNGKKRIQDEVVYA
jgi:hypothetical protein